MLNLQQFLLDHPNNYKELLAEKPYCIDIKEKGNLRLFKYNQIASDFNNPLVRECRGIILEVDTWMIVAYPFKKFDNYGQDSCDKIDWNTAIVSEKIDGSLIKFYYYDNKWNIATNGTIDAFDAQIESFGNILPYKSFGELVISVLQNKGLEPDLLDALLDREYTYMFELTSPYTKVVVPHEKVDLHFLGCRDNNTFKEESFYLHPLSKIFSIPKTYSLSSLQDCIDSASKLPFSEEGYVAVDNNFNRVKIKSPAYVAVHHLKGEGGISISRAIDLIKLGEIEEFLNYFPEFKSIIMEIKNKYDLLVKRLYGDYSTYFCIKGDFANRKEMALWNMKNCLYPSIQFSMADHKYECFDDAFKDIKNDTLIELMKKVE
jgi:hypothetical protein